MTYPTRFENLLDLARLPWFEEKDGGLVLADRRFEGAIDVHTHLSLAFLLPNSVDLVRDTGRTEYYLPAGNPLDLDIYANRNMTAADVTRLKWDLSLVAMTPFGMRRTHTAGNLSREMAGLGVRRSILLAIDLPWISDNAGRWLDAVRGREEFVVFGSVHPLAGDVAARLDAQKERGARGIKFHPQAQFMAPDHPKVLELCRLAGERDLPVLFHCGPVGIEPEAGRRRCQVDRYRAVLESCPGTVFVLGHSGALQIDRAIELANRLPNVWMEVASQSLTGVRRVIDETDPRRVLLGSDWPFYHQAIALAKVLIATEGRDDLRLDVLYRNAERLLGLPGAARAA